MSLPRQIEVTCSDCGSTQPFTTWQTLNAQLNPDAKEALMQGELTRLTCTKCGSATDVVYPLLYHDSDRKLMIWLGGNQRALETGALPVTAFMRDYQFRVVTTRNQLVEKIRIFESGLDDRLLEFAKFIFRRGAANAGRTLNGELLFNGPGQTATGEAAIQFVLLTSGEPEYLTTLMSQLEKYSRALGDRLPAAKAEAARWIAVDADYAAKLASQY